MVKEVIFVGIPGPTHNYGGLVSGNIASEVNAGNISRPRKAALQSLTLMRQLLKLGVKVGVLPPQLRPHIETLESLGYSGKPEQIIKAVAKADFKLLAKLYSSAAMWTANAATVCPAIDSGDKKLHILTANLTTHLSRAVEAEDTYRVLKNIFQGRDFAVHEPFPQQSVYADEGAANHIRLCPNHKSKGLHIFVYGRDAINPSPKDPKKYIARQTLQASKAMAKLFGLSAKQVLYLHQNPEIIDKGVFHNDVISVGNENVFIYHEKTFADPDAIKKIMSAYKKLNNGKKPVLIKISSKQVSVEDAVKTYLFNSQLITLAGGRMKLIAPKEARDNKKVKAAIDSIITDSSNPINSVSYIDLKQSMKNGGGPACLRLRVVMSDAQIKNVGNHSRVFIDENKLKRLEKWIRKHYPAQLKPKDLANPKLYIKSIPALKELSGILKIPVVK